MILILKTHIKKTSLPYSVDFWWYDHDEKKMKVLRGGQMKLEIVNKRLVPKVIDNKIVRYKNNREDILRWIKSKANLLEIQSDNGQEIRVHVDDYYLNSLQKELNKLSFDYEVEEE